MVISVWHYTGGRNRHIGDLLREGSHSVETWGNVREGFAVYLAQDNIGIPICRSPFARRSDADAAIYRAFATDDFRPLIKRGNNFHSLA